MGRALPAAGASARPTGVSQRQASPAVPFGWVRRDHLPQSLADRGPGDSHLGRRRGDGVHGSRALADLSDPCPVAAPAGTLRPAGVPALSRGLPEASAAVALHRSDHPRPAPRGSRGGAERVQPPEAPGVRAGAGDGGAAQLRARPRSGER